MTSIDRQEPAAAQVFHSDSLSDVTKMINVLHVDDDVDFLVLSKLFLNHLSNNLNVTSTGNALLALIQLESKRFDVVVADYEMPGMNGLQLLERMRENRDNTPFIILTGRDGEDIVSKAFNLGADNCLRKSTHPEVMYTGLISSINKAIEKECYGRSIEVTTVKH